jgi:hypothetical protein
MICRRLLDRVSLPLPNAPVILVTAHGMVIQRSRRFANRGVGPYRSSVRTSWPQHPPFWISFLCLGEFFARKCSLWGRWVNPEIAMTTDAERSLGDVILFAGLPAEVRRSYEQRCRSLGASNPAAP